MMTKNKITDYDQTADANEDISGIGIKGSDPVRNMDNALREIMSHLADMNAGDAPLHDTLKIANALDASKGLQFDASQVTSGEMRILTAPDIDGVIITDTEFTAISGAGKGFDADLLDGQEGTFYQNASNLNDGTIGDAYLPDVISSDVSGNAATATMATHSNSADKIKNTSDAIKSMAFDFIDVADNSEIALKVPSKSGTISITQFTVSTDAPTGGEDGDIWLQVDS